MIEFNVSEYVTKDGYNPFGEWIESLDKTAKARVSAYLRRFSEGNLGQNRHLGKGLCEAKLNFGPGYRLYFGIHGGQLLILLSGGAKGSQVRDIELARRYWDNYLEDHS